MPTDPLPAPSQVSLPVAPGVQMLSVATVATSLVLQAPVMWDTWRSAAADITFASAADGFEERLARWGRHVEIRISRSPWCVTRPTVWRDASRLLRREWQFVQLQSPVAGAVARLALPRTRNYPVVYVAHGFHFHRDGGLLSNLAYRTVEESLAGRADAIMVVSGEDFDVARSGPIGRRTRMYHLPGAGIDVEAFSSAAPERLFPEEALVALFCGELIPRKDPMAAVEAVLQARGVGRDVRLVVAGDGALRPELERYLGRPDSGDWLRHIPFSDGMPGLTKAADVLISTSSQEGLPRVLVEALAAGVPIISVANRGSRELLADGFGRLVAQGDVSALRDALVNFRRDDFPTIGEMRSRADAYSSQRVAAAYAAAVIDVLSS